MNKGTELFFEIFKKEQDRNTKDEPLYSKNLRINPYLLEWTETVNISTSTSAGHSHSINTITHPSKLNIGSYVACYGIEYDSKYNEYKRYCVLEVIS